MSLSVELITNERQLSNEDRTLWNALAGNPLMRWEWLGSWWDAYRSQYELCILAVKRDGETVAFAPWCAENRLGTGRTIQFLGSGKACTDHLSLLVQPDDTELVCQAIAQSLSDELITWDSIELIGVDQSDQPINCLVETLRGVGLEVEQSEGMGCYAIDLPSSWDEYVNLRSKSGRREIRQSLKKIDDETITVSRIKDHAELDQFWDQFVLLHQSRRHAEGTTGCFDHPPFGTFLRSAADQLLRAGLLEFVVASVDDVPVAAQFAIADDDGWYFYQSGMSPEAAELRPGMGVFCHAIRQSIASKRKRFDMMRGDEAYKLRWRAELIPAQEVRVCSPRTSAQLRQQIYKAGLNFKHLVKSGLGIGQPQQ